MSELKTLKELVASITDWETRQKMSTKPFRPCFLDLIISPLAPQFYNKEELAQVEKLHNLYSRVSTRSKAKNKKSEPTKRCREIENMMLGEEEAMPVNKKPRKIFMPKYGPAPDLPAQFKNRISELNGHDIKFLMHKTLFKSDLKANNNRLSMPLNQIMCDFLTESEKAILEEREDISGTLKGVEITALDPSLREFTLQLNKWGMDTVDVYNLVKNWKKVASTNDFEKGDELHIWSFRVHDKLYLLLNKI